MRPLGGPPRGRRRLVGEATFELPGDLPLGYHTCAPRSGERSAGPLIVTPGLARRSPSGWATAAAWGLAAQLYSVRSRQSWGVGDLGDLEDLAVWSAAELGAGYVLVNPLHAAEPVAADGTLAVPADPRRFQNPLYLRVERIPEYADLPAAAGARSTRSRRACTRELDEPT